MELIYGKPYQENYYESEDLLEDYEAKFNLDDFPTEEVVLIDPSLHLGSNFGAIYEEVKRYYPQTLQQLEYRYLNGRETEEQKQKKLSLALVVLHDDMYPIKKNIDCCAFHHFESSEVGWLLTAFELWAAQHQEKKTMTGR